jgi:hypothetical protein
MGTAAKFGKLFSDLLTPTGSIVIEMGNAWEPGRPVISTLALRSLLMFIDSAKLNLCQQFVWHNPAKLPSPAQWVNVERIRVKDSYTHVWWLAKTDRPYADNRQILAKYSDSMESLKARGWEATLWLCTARETRTWQSGPSTLPSCRGMQANPDVRSKAPGDRSYDWMNSNQGRRSAFQSGLCASPRYDLSARNETGTTSPKLHPVELASSLFLMTTSE